MVSAYVVIDDHGVILSIHKTAQTAQDAHVDTDHPWQQLKPGEMWEREDPARHRELFIERHQVKP